MRPLMPPAALISSIAICLCLDGHRAVGLAGAGERFHHTYSERSLLPLFIPFTGQERRWQKNQQQSYSDKLFPGRESHEMLRSNASPDH